MAAHQPQDTGEPASPQHLADAIRRREVILFAGGGISQNLGLPDFNELICHICNEMQIDPGSLNVGDYPVVAEAYIKTSGRIGTLRSWMDTTWHPSSTDVAASPIHNLIVDLDFPTIYTTNYDRWLEAAFAHRKKPYRKIMNVADLMHPLDGSTEIIKFHGDFEDDNSLVLTETSYFQRMSFETPLDIRLRADSLARPLLFLGYSLNDINTRYLLFRLQELWDNFGFAAQRPKSYIFMTEPHPAQEIVLRSRGIEPLVWSDTSPGRATQRFLESLLHVAVPSQESKLSKPSAESRPKQRRGKQQK